MHALALGGTPSTGVCEAGWRRGTRGRAGSTHLIRISYSRADVRHSSSAGLNACLAWLRSNHRHRHYRRLRRRRLRRRRVVRRRRRRRGHYRSACACAEPLSATQRREVDVRDGDVRRGLLCRGALVSVPTGESCADRIGARRRRGLPHGRLLRPILADERSVRPVHRIRPGCRTAASASAVAAAASSPACRARGLGWERRRLGEGLTSWCVGAGGRRGTLLARRKEGRGLDEDVRYDGEAWDRQAASLHEYILVVHLAAGYVPCGVLR